MHGEGAHVPELRRVRPLHLTFHEFAWYVLCWDLKAEDHRCYMLTRMNSVKETGTGFVRPKNFDARKILRKNFAIFTSGEPEEVALEFSPKVARMVQERQWHKIAEVYGASGWERGDDDAGGDHAGPGGVDRGVYGGLPDPGADVASERCVEAAGAGVAGALGGGVVPGGVWRRWGPQLREDVDG